MPAFKRGDLISFSYRKEETTHDLYPQVLVLHENWKGNVHALNFNYLDEQERNYVKAILNPTFAEEISKKDPQIRMELARVGAAAVTTGKQIDSPYSFYVRFVKGFAKKHNSYRKYKPEKIFNVRILATKDEMQGKKKGLFDKVTGWWKSRGPKT